jgi:hypothetical protein
LTTAFVLVGVGFAGDLLEEAETAGLGLVMLGADGWPLTRPALLRGGGLCVPPNLRDQLEVDVVSSAPPACRTGAASSSEMPCGTVLPAVRVLLVSGRTSSSHMH